jgi:hypothetical protein
MTSLNKAILLDKSTLQALTPSEIQSLAAIGTILLTHALLAELHSTLAKDPPRGGPAFAGLLARKLQTAHPFFLEPYPTTLAREFVRGERVTGFPQPEAQSSSIYTQLMLEELATGGPISQANKSFATMLREDIRQNLGQWLNRSKL